MTLPIFGSWATAETNYPAGSNPWNGTPVNVAPVGDIFTPGTKPPAQNFNYLLNQLFTQDKNGYYVALTSALNNWSGAVIPPVGGETWQAFCWDPAFSRWLGISSQAAVSTHISDSIDGGRSWATFGVPSVTGAAVVAMAASPGGTILYVQTGNSHAIGSFDSGGTAHDFIVTSMTAATCFYYGAASQFVVIGGAQSGGTFIGAAFATNGTAAPTDVHTSLPAAWQTSTNHVVSMFAAVGVNDALVSAQGTTVGTDTSRLLHVTFPSSTLTFTDVTPSVATGKRITGVAWDANNVVWVILVDDGTNQSVYYSANLSSWTLATTFASQFAIGLGVVGGVWALLLPLSTASHRTNTARMQITADLGATWHVTQSSIATTAITFLQQSVVGGPNGLLMGHSADVYVSQVAGLT